MMKFLLPLLFSCSALGAIPSTAVWEVRSTATTNNPNGCFFNPSNVSAGADYSKQDAAQYQYANLTSANGTTNPCIVSSASHNFVASDIGNGLHITAGTNWTFNWYEIVSISGTAAVLDRACGTAATLNGGSFYVGGACSFNSTSPMTGMVAGNKLWVKAGTYTITSVGSSTAGTALLPIVVEGYNTTRGDRPRGSDRPLFNIGNSTTWTANEFVEWRNLQWTGNHTTNAVFYPGNGNKVIDSKITNTSTTANCIAAGATGSAGAGTAFINTELSAPRGYGYWTNVNMSAIFDGCYFHDSNIGIQTSTTTAGMTILNSIFEGIVNTGINIANSGTNNITVSNNTFYGAENKLGTGVAMAAGSKHVRLLDNIFYGLATGVSHADSGNVWSNDYYNAYHNNTTNVSNWVLGPGSISGTDPQFKSMSQTTGTNGTTSGSVLTSSGATFPTFVSGVDFLYLKSGTGITAGIYGIVSNTGTTITLDSAPGTDATADKVFQVTTGHNLMIGSNLKALGGPGLFPGGVSVTTSYIDIGAAQKKGGATTGSSH